LYRYDEPNEPTEEGSLSYVHGASKIKLKKVNKKRTVTVRRVINFYEYLKASIADLFTMSSSSVKNSEGRGDSDIGDSFADPCKKFKGFFRVSSGLPLV
jgi:hypothetical protein